ncbi:MAG: molecular chaperone DnaJ [Acidimicrobiia bacterium]
MAPQREWFEKDYYKVLGVPEDAPAKDITKAYRKLARQFHPDANPDNTAAEERFKEISAAYDVIGDETKRKEYDEVRKLGPMGAGFGGGPGAGGPGMGGFRFDVGGDNDFGDIFGNLFGGRGRRGGGGGGAGSARGAGPQRGNDIEAELKMSFTDAVSGLTTTLQLIADAACSTCNGSGAKPGTSPRVCQVCRGRGVTDDNQGLFSFSKPCYACNGNGVIVDSPCPTCRGTGIEHRPREVKVRIPPGVDDGQRIRLKGRGAPGRNGGAPGDLFVTVKVQGHQRYGRDGNNLTLRVPVTLAEAALGADISVPLLDGTRVTLRIKPGTQPGTKQRVKGKGVETAKGTGDLVVTFDLAVPTKLSSAERKALEDLQKATKESPRAHLEG